MCYVHSSRHSSFIKRTSLSLSGPAPKTTAASVGTVVNPTKRSAMNGRVRDHMQDFDATESDTSLQSSIASDGRRLRRKVSRHV